MFGPRYLKYAWGGKWGFVGNFIAAAAAILPPLRGHFLSFVIYVTRKPKRHFLGRKQKKPKKTGEKGVVLLAQTFYLPLAFQLVQRRPEGSTVSFFSAPPPQVVQKLPCWHDSENKEFKYNGPTAYLAGIS